MLLCNKFSAGSIGKRERQRQRERSNAISVQFGCRQALERLSFVWPGSLSLWLLSLAACQGAPRAAGRPAKVCAWNAQTFVLSAKIVALPLRQRDRACATHRHARFGSMAQTLAPQTQNPSCVRVHCHRFTCCILCVCLSLLFDELQV